MNFAIYKAGQGLRVRWLSAIGYGMLALAGVDWIVRQQMAAVDAGWPKYLTATVLILGLGVAGYFLMNAAKVVDFFIATEAEVNQVNWPPKAEIIGATTVVIFGSMFFSLLLFVIDLIFTKLFLSIGILQGANG